MNVCESYEETYRDCLERHWVYVRVLGTGPGSPTVIQQGIGNVLADMANIGGNYFSIELPDKRYYK